MLLAPRLLLNDNPRRLLENLLLYDLDLSYCYNLFDDRINNPLVFLCIHSDDTIDMWYLCAHRLVENLYSDDQMLLHSSLRNYDIVHRLLDMIVLYDLPLDCNLFDGKIHNHPANLLLFRYGSLNTATADVNLLM